MVVQHLMVALDLAAVTVDRVGEFFWCRMLEMHSLAREGAEARGDKHQPREQFRSVLRPALELSGLFGQVTTKRPSFGEPGGDAMFEYGNYDLIHGAVNLNAPVDDQLAFRFATNFET
jgi:hypothetical protein